MVVRINLVAFYCIIIFVINGEDIEQHSKNKGNGLVHKTDCKNKPNGKYSKGPCYGVYYECEKESIKEVLNCSNLHIFDQGLQKCIQKSKSQECSKPSILDNVKLIRLKYDEICHIRQQCSTLMNRINYRICLKIVEQIEKDLQEAIYASGMNYHDLAQLYQTDPRFLIYLNNE